jgi:hypothetical protein
MMDGLIAGKIFGAAEERTDKNGKPFVVLKALASCSDGESVIVNVIAFDTDTCQTLMALHWRFFGIGRSLDAQGMDRQARNCSTVT